MKEVIINLANLIQSSILIEKEDNYLNVECLYQHFINFPFGTISSNLEVVDYIINENDISVLFNLKGDLGLYFFQSFEQEESFLFLIDKRKIDKFCLLYKDPEEESERFSDYALKKWVIRNSKLITLK